MSDKQEETKKHNVQADDQSIAIDSIDFGGDVSGDISIGHTIGYTADDVSVLIEQISSTFQPKSFDGRPPYKGLDVFEEEDTELFFGREKIVADLVERVKESRTVFITGPSGSGKSSLVRAGLIPALKQGGLKNSERWLYETVKPGRDPLEALALAFSRLKSPELGNYFRENVHHSSVLHECAESALSGQKDQRLLLFFDQFEEVFTQVRYEETRAAFLDLLTYAATVENGRVIILFAMRSDFVSNCATYPELNALLNQEFVQIGAMGPDELVSAIAQPALRVGLRIDPDLIAQIINDMQGEPGALPLMQFALKDLFEVEQAKGGVIALTREAYLQRGGIQKSLERHADASFAKLEVHEQELARSIFGGLIEIGRGTQDTRRTALFDELIPANVNADEIETIVRKLADARLITTDELAGKDLVTISHEKLIDAWPWLKKLVDENREAIGLQNQIATDAKEWEDKKRDSSYLYTGARLANAREQLEAKKLVLSGRANEFVQAGFSRQQRELRTRFLSIAGVIGLIIAGIMFFSYISTANSNRLAEQSENSANTQVALANTSQAIAVTAQASEQEAQKRANIARANELSSNAVDSNALDVSVLLGIEAVKTANTFYAKNAMLNSLESTPFLTQILHLNVPRIQKYFSWNWISDSSMRQAANVSFSPDGKIMATGSCAKIETITDPIEHSVCLFKEVILWDVHSHQIIGNINIREIGDYGPYNLAFSPDSKLLAAISSSSLIVWDVTSKDFNIVHSEATMANWSLIFSADNKTLFLGTKDGWLKLIDITTGEETFIKLDDLTSGITDLAISPDGNILAIGGCGNIENEVFCNQGRIILWDINSRTVIGGSINPHSDYVTSLAFSPDGSYLASGSCTYKDTVNNQCLKGEVNFWSVETSPDGENFLFLLNTYYEHSDFVSSLIFASDYLISGSLDNSITIGYYQKIGGLDNTFNIISMSNKSAYPLEGLALSPDNILALSYRDGTVVLWDMSNPYAFLQYQGSQTNSNLLENGTLVYSSVVSPNGQILAIVTDNRHTVKLWDVKTLEPYSQPINDPSNSIYEVIFSPDGKTLLTSGDDTISIWDVTTGELIGKPLNGYNPSFSPTGGMLAFARTDDDKIVIWNLEDSKSTGVIIDGTGGPVSSLAFSYDGRMLALSSGHEKPIILWNVISNQRIGDLEHDSPDINSLAFSQDSNFLASSGVNFSIVIWDIALKQPIYTMSEIGERPIDDFVFSPDGNMLFSTNRSWAWGQEKIFLWDIDSQQSIGEPIMLNLLGRTIGNISITPDGNLREVFAGEMTVWDFNPSSWVDSACQIVGRNFSLKEWTQYFPNEEYRKTCEQWPLEPEFTVTSTSVP